MEASPSAAELIDSCNRLSADVFAAFDRAYRDVLAGVIRRAERDGELHPRRAGLDAAAAADLIACAARGVETESGEHGGGGEAAFRERLDRLVRFTVAGLAAPESRAGGRRGSRALRGRACS